MHLKLAHQSVQYRKVSTLQASSSLFSVRLRGSPIASMTQEGGGGGLSLQKPQYRGSSPFMNRRSVVQIEAKCR